MMVTERALYGCGGDPIDDDRADEEAKLAMNTNDRIAALESELAQARADHLAAIEQARKEEREVWSKWADAVVAELELRAKINNDPYLEISRLRFVELDTLRARKP